MRIDEDKGAPTPPGGHHRWTSLLGNLWVVPYARRNPPMLMWCMPGGTLHHPLWAKDQWRSHR